MPEDVFDALQAEHDQLEGLLRGLPPSDWDAPSRCEGWSVSDVVLHLAQTEEAVPAVMTGAPFGGSWMEGVTSVDEAMAAWVAAEKGPAPEAVLDRWSKARRAALDALRAADPSEPITWVAAPLKPRTLATTRLSEHWIHAHDIADPLGAHYPDTERLWHLCWLAHRTLGYAFSAAGLGKPPDVHLELSSPSGDVWSFGEEGAPCQIRGPAAEFCGVAGRRLKPEEAAGIEARGDGVEDVLRLVRTYA